MKKFLLFLCLLALMPTVSQAGQLEDATLEMRYRLGQSLFEQQQMSGELNQLRAWLGTAQQEEARLKQNLERLLSMQQEVNQELPRIMLAEKQVQEELDSLRGQYHGQLVGIYLYAPDANEWVFANADDFSQAMETRQNLDIVLGARLDSLRELQLKAADLELGLISLQARQRQIQELANELKLTQADLDELAQRRRQAGEELETRQRQLRENQAALTQAQARLQRASQTTLPGIGSSQAPDTGALEGKGSFYSPVQGQLLDSKGFSLLRAAAGSVVRAPWAGVVAFAEHVPGYGLLVVIDHGQRLHSVLAHLDQVQVAPGQVLGAGQPLGRLDSSGLLYMEIRSSAKPQPVADWLFSGAPNS